MRPQPKPSDLNEERGGGSVVVREEEKLTIEDMLTEGDMDEATLEKVAPKHEDDLEEVHPKTEYELMHRLNTMEFANRYIYVNIYIHKYVFTHIYMYTYIYTYIYTN